MSPLALAPRASTSAAADPYDCATYPSPFEGGATKAPTAYWPSDQNSTSSDMRACVAYPNYYMVQCCGTASSSAAIHDPKCGWEVCISETTDEEWEKCFKTLDAQRGATNSNKYSFNCVAQKKSKSKSDDKEKEKSGARRAVLSGAIFAAACAAVSMVF